MAYEREPHWSNRPKREDIIMVECLRCNAPPGQWCKRDMAEFTGCPEALALCAAGTPPSHQERKLLAQGIKPVEIADRMLNRRRGIPDTKRKPGRSRRQPKSASRQPLPAPRYISPDEPAWAEEQRGYQVTIARLETRVAELQGQVSALDDRVTRGTARADQAEMRVRDLEDRLDDALRNMPCGYRYEPPDGDWG
jgi:hypothetical protein